VGVLLIFLVNYLLLSVGLYLLFPKVGIDAWKGLVPGLNFAECCKLIGRPGWWAFLLLIPIVQFFIYAGLMIHLVKSFGRTSWFDSFLAVVFPIAILYQIAKNDKDKYLGPYYTDRKAYQSLIEQAKKSGDKREYNKLMRNDPYKLSIGREWAESIIFAVFAAAFIRMFLVEAFMIPTPSMENSLNVGDYLFVSKTRYGMRTPMTVAQIPLLHNRLPFVNGESYLKKPNLPYFRFPAFETIDKNDPIVFNWPIGDSTLVEPGRTFAYSQFERPAKYIVETLGKQTSRSEKEQARLQSARLELKKLESKKDDIKLRPIDKKDHYIKRCVAVGGDSIQIINRQIYINGKAVENPTNIQFQYSVKFGEGSVNTKKWGELGISQADVIIIVPNRGMARWDGSRSLGNTLTYIHLNQKQKAYLENSYPGIVIEHIVQEPDGNRLFPHNAEYFGGWTVDDFGPVWVPKAGATIDLTPQNIAMYYRTIDVYEHNDVERAPNGLIINGEQVNTYTFKQDYFWAMGDNRHNSEDSRAWGFVPHDHIVGKPLFMFFSTREGSIAKGVNWNRIFSSANKM
jgi:signal peptidase I